MFIGWFNSSRIVFPKQRNQRGRSSTDKWWNFHRTRQSYRFKAKDNCKILVVGNPANTNTLIGYHNAGNKNQTWMAMTMLDALRAKAQLSIKLGCHVDEIASIVVFWLLLLTMFPLKIPLLMVKMHMKQSMIPLGLRMNFLPKIQQRGAEIIAARGASSASSAARAACDTVKTVEHPTRSGDVFNAAIISDGSYGIPEGIFLAFHYYLMEMEI